MTFEQYRWHAFGGHYRNTNWPCAVTAAAHPMATEALMWLCLGWYRIPIIDVKSPRRVAGYDVH